MNRPIAGFTAALLLALPGLTSLAQDEEAGKQTRYEHIGFGESAGRGVDRGLSFLVQEQSQSDVEQDAVDRGLSFLLQVQSQSDIEQDALELAMAEDVEVMKRILDEALEDAYQPGKQAVWVSFAEGRSSLMTLRDLEVDSDLGGSQIEDALAVSLDGYGVVFQLKAPPLGEEPEKKEADPGAVVKKPPTRWEATRLRLLGTQGAPTEIKGSDADLQDLDVATVWDVTVFDASVADPSEAVPTRSLLTQKLLDLLAENGHNFRRLRPEERLTIALTFRTGAASDDDTRLNAVYRGRGDGRFEDVTEKISGQTDIESGLYMDLDNDGNSGLYIADGHGKVTDELTGDLHLRQGNYQDAIAAYEKVIREAVKGDPYGHQPTGEQVSMYQKLLQAQVGAGQYAKARRLMEAIQNARAKPPSPERPKPHFPARLVVSATKAQLDQVAAGTMTREQFAEEAMVEYSEPKPLEAGPADSE